MFVRMPGQGPRSCAAAPAAVGETILSGEGFISSPAKWWGPAVLEAACGRTSYWAIREPAPLPSRLAPDGCGLARFPVFLHPAHGGRRALEGSQTKGVERTDMPRKSNPVDALKKLREQRDELAAKEAKLRDEAAIVLGHILIECGAETIEPAQLRQIVRGAMALGIEETLKRIAPA